LTLLLATRVVASVIGVYSAILVCVVDVPAVASVPDIAGVLLASPLLETLLTFRLLTVSLLLLATILLLVGSPAISGFRSFAGVPAFNTSLIYCCF
jgi:hypothetical protein